MAYFGLTLEPYYPIYSKAFSQGAEQPCRGHGGPVYKISKPTYFSDNEKISPYAASCNSRFYYLRQGLALSVAMYASDPAFYNYRSGIIADCKYPVNTPVGINHAVILVGYQMSNEGENYLIVKNSWGSSWGENGHFRVNNPQVNANYYSKCFLCNHAYFNMY